MTDHSLVERVALLKKLGYSPEKALDAAREDIRQQREAEERRQQREAEAKEREAEAKQREAEERRQQREAEAKREAERQQRILMIMQDSSLTSTQRQAALETLGDARSSFSQGLALTEYFRVSCMHSVMNCHCFVIFSARFDLQPFLDFARWCRSDQPAVQMLDLSDKFPSVSPPTEGLRGVRVLCEGRAVLEANLLPKSWPFFAASKQKNALKPTATFRRLGRSDVGRVEKTLQLLRRRGHVAWIGAPGLGKSAGLNGVLNVFLNHLGEKGWPRQVAIRVEEQVVAFEVDDAGKLEAVGYEARTLRDLIPVSRKLEKGGAVLLLELSEDETNPVVHCPTLVTISNRDARTQLKEMHKAGMVWLVMSPWTLEELEAAALILWAMQQQTEGSTPESSLAEVKYRLEAVGPVPRFVLGTEETFRVRVAEQLGIQATEFIAAARCATIFNVPSEATYYLAPFVHDDVDIPTIHPDNWRWEFLSMQRAQSAALLARKNPELLDILARHGLRWQVQEAVVGLALLDHPNLAFEHKLSSWEWAKDRGSAKLAQKCQVPEGFGVVKNVSYFFGRYLCCDVRELDENTLYRSTSWQMVACDFIRVNHKYRTVFAIQVSERLPKDHPVKAGQITKIQAKMNLKNEYDLQFVFVVPFQKCKKWPTGMVVKCEDSTLQNIGAGFIVQACITPGDPPGDVHTITG